MSDRGSILISTANDIGEALVEKLGGEGYAPSVWDKEYNKLGIADVDAAPALSVLENSSETGTARGSILMSTANAVGAMLNKKYNTDRGFKPKEWASAASKLAPLPEKSAESSPICSFDDGADDVPIKNWLVTLPASLDGYSEVNGVQTGRNLVALNASPQQAKRDYGITVNTQTADALNITSTGVVYACERLFYSFKKGTYAIKYLATSSDSYTPTISIYRTNGTGVKFSIQPNTLTTFTLSEDTNIDIRLFASGSGDTTIRTVEYTNLQIEVGSTVSTYSQYNSTTYTASLGRTIYGGTADIVNGTGTDNGKKIKLNTLWWSYDDTSYSYGFFLIPSNISDMTENLKFVCTNYINNGHPRNQLLDGEIGVFNLSNSNRRLVIRDDSCTTLEQFLTKIADYDLVYESTTDTPFTFTGQEIPTRLGYNAFWSDQGNTALDYYGEPEPYTRGTASGAIANVQSARTDLPFTKVKANIAPNFAGVSEVKVFNTDAGLVTVPDVSGSITNAYFYNIGTGYTLTAGVTYKITMVVNSTVNPFAVSVGVGDGSAYRYDIYNTGIVNNNGVVSFEFIPESSHLTTWDKLWIRAPRYSAPSGSQQTTCTFTVTNILLYTSAPTTYTADLGEPVYGGSVDLVRGEKVKTSARLKISDLNWSIQTVSGRSAFVSGQVSNMPTTSPKIVLCDVLPYDGEKTIGGMTDKTLATWTNTFRIYDTDIADVTELISTYGNGYITYPLVTDIESSITPQVISPGEGVNNLWNNAGGDTDVEYFTTE